MSISEADIDQFRSRVVGRSISEDTFDAYKLWIGRFEEWFDGDTPSLRDLEDFDTMLHDPDQSFYEWTNSVGRPAPASYSYSSRLQAICAIKMWVRRQYDVTIPEQPGDIVVGEEGTFSPSYLPPDRVSETIRSAGSDCNCDGCAAALAVSYDAILRASEMVQLDMTDFDRSEGTLAVSATKKSRDSTLELGDSTIEELTAYIDSCDHSSGRLFRNTYGDPWTKQAWSTHVLRYHVPEGSHAWGRHTPILHMLQAGVSFGDVYRRARHKSPDTTARYARYVDVDAPDWAND